MTGRLQLPLPLQNTFTMFQGVGLLLPELLLRRRRWLGAHPERLSGRGTAWRRGFAPGRIDVSSVPALAFGFFVASAKPSAPASWAWSRT